MRHLSASLPETTALAASALTQLLPSKHAGVLALYGDLGSGKTTFVQELAGVLGISEVVTSPTFVIMKTYKIQNKQRPPNAHGSMYKLFFHIDCYRLESDAELANLGWRDILAEPTNLIAVEWADKVERLLPPEALRVRFKFIDDRTREIDFE